ncbi:MAG: hypothetical protein AAGA12_11220 [Pseudomonadota bacterium]
MAQSPVSYEPVDLKDLSRIRREAEVLRAQALRNLFLRGWEKLDAILPFHAQKST